MTSYKSIVMSQNIDLNKLSLDQLAEYVKQQKKSKKVNQRPNQLLSNQK